MASNIDTTDIDTAYPVAGQDNDSQGFRDNFTLIVDALDEAALEITALDDNLPDARTPSELGSSGDKKGMIAYDATYIYICTKDHDGTAIWIRSPLTAW